MVPKPAAAPTALKSQALSERPTKSRTAGSVDQARRSAAGLTSAGTPAARNGWRSDPGPIESREGKQAGSNGGSTSLATGVAKAAGASSAARSWLGWRLSGGAAARLRRAQRARKDSESAIAVPVLRAV